MQPCTHTLSDSTPYLKSNLHHLRLQYPVAAFCPKTPSYPLIIYHHFFFCKYPENLYYPIAISHHKHTHYPK